MEADKLDTNTQRRIEILTVFGAVRDLIAALRKELPDAMAKLSETFPTEIAGEVEDAMRRSGRASLAQLNQARMHTNALAQALFISEHPPAREED